MRPRRLKAVLVGAGQFASYHAEAWNRIADVHLSAVADSVPDKARAFADRHGVLGAYDSVDHMLERERPDFVDIVTRPESHLELTRLAAARGTHVLCQKPMAASVAEANQMVEICDQAGVRLLIHENWRWQPWYRVARACLENGEIGDPFQIAFRWRTGDGRGVDPYQTQPYFRSMPMLLVYETLVHLLDTFRFLGGEVTEVQARLARVNPNIQGEDQALVSLAFASGAFGLIDANRISGPFPPPVAMGSLTMEGDRGVLTVHPDGRIEVTGHGEGSREIPCRIPAEGYKGDSVYATQQHFVRALLEDRPAETEARDYLNTVALVEACYVSARREGANVPVQSPLNDSGSFVVGR